MPHKFELSKINVKKEQSSAIKFCCLLKKSVMETVNLMPEVCTDKEWLTDPTIFHQHNKAFSEGRETSALLVAVVVQKDCHITVGQLAQALDISKSSAHTILRKKFEMWRVVAC